MGRISCICSLLLLTALGCFSAHEAEVVMGPQMTEPPVVWQRPAAFDPDKDGFGLEPLPGTELSYVYKPLVSHADPAEGGRGVYESTMHGTYNHHQQFALMGDYVIIFWTNHVRDENGPGQRLLARVGRFAPDGSAIEWGDDGVVEMAPPVQAPHRRPASDDGDTVTGLFLDGTISLHGDRLFVKGGIKLCDGWTDSMLYHHTPNTEPVPDEHYSKGKTRSHRFDIYWILSSFVQEWKLVDGRLLPASEIYLTRPPISDRLQVTPTICKKMGRLNPLYANARPLQEAPADFRQALAVKETIYQSTPKFAPGTAKNAADGKNGLAHQTEFVRPDGKYVVMRDNLLNVGNYYASLKNNADECYAPAVETNFFGAAMPVSGTLPDGTVWFVGSDVKRQNAYVTWSKDGIHFDKTRLLLHMYYEGTPGLNCPKGGGPQYFQTITRGRYVWLVFSINKERIGLLKVPFASFK